MADNEPTNGSKPNWKETIEIVSTHVTAASDNLKEVFTLQNHETNRLLKALHGRLDMLNNESVAHRALADKRAKDAEDLNTLEHNNIKKEFAAEIKVIDEKVDKIRTGVWKAVVSFFGGAGLLILAAAVSKFTGWL